MYVETNLQITKYKVVETNLQKTNYLDCVNDNNSIYATTTTSQI